MRSVEPTFKHHVKVKRSEAGTSFRICVFDVPHDHDTHDDDIVIDVERNFLGMCTVDTDQLLLCALADQERKPQDVKRKRAKMNWGKVAVKTLVVTAPRAAAVSKMQFNLVDRRRQVSRVTSHSSHIDMI
jgi:hypothetical protein